MTRDLRLAEGRMRIVLPGTWVSIPLGESPEQIVAHVKRVVRRQVGAADRLARARREAVQELVGSARDAIEIGAHTYLMSLELLPGVPFPAAIVAVDEEWPAAGRAMLGDVPGTGPDDSGTRPDDSGARPDDEAVAAALRAAYPDGEVAPQRTGPVCRVAEMVRAEVGEDGDELLTMRLQYHVPYPDRSRLLLASVNVPNIPSAEPFATLFDEILDSLVFMEQETPA